jgi:hypothetical protein
VRKRSRGWRLLERFDDGPTDRTLERLLGVFAPGADLRDVVLPDPCEVGERWSRGDATIAQEHFASNFLEGRAVTFPAWTMWTPRGWVKTAGERTCCSSLAGAFRPAGGRRSTRRWRATGDLRAVLPAVPAAR